MAILTSSSAAEKKKPSHEQQTEGEKNEHDVLQKIDHAIDRCRELFKTPFISQKTKQEFEEMMHNEVRAKKKAEWAEQNVTFLRNTITQAEAYYSVYRAKLDEAVRNKWINNDSRTRWIDRFFDGNLLEMDRKEWLFDKNRKDAFPTMLENWKETAKKRDEVLELAKNNDTTDKDVPELRDLLNQDAFLSFHYNVRVHKTAKAKALVLAKKANNKELSTILAKTEDTMETWARKGIMHSLKIGEWLERIALSEDPVKFVSSVLHAFKKNWQNVRTHYDNVTASINNQDLPVNCAIISADKFLLLTYGERVAYCALLESHNTELRSQDRQLASLKLHIQTMIDANDMDDARKAMSTAQTLNPNDPELSYLNTLIDQNKQQENGDKNEDALKLQEQANALIMQLPIPLRDLYTAAAMRGSEALNTVMRSVHNRIRWHQYGSMNERTEERLRLEGGTNPTDEDSPFLDTANSATEVVLERLTTKTTHRDEEEDMIEETENTLIAPISYAAQYDAVATVHKPLKMAIKQLESLKTAYEG